MAGRHARPSPARPRTGIIAAAAIAVALVAGGTAGMVHLSRTPSAADSGVGQPTHAPSDPVGSITPTASPLPERSAERASRGEVRSAPPSTAPSATRTAAPSPTRAAPSPTRAAASPSKTASGNVVASGTCGASFYYEPQPTASGERFDPEALTAAHKTWAFNTRVKVTNPANGKSVVVRINDRGPYIDGRCLDLSRAAFRAIADLNLGVINVRYEILAP